MSMEVHRGFHRKKENAMAAGSSNGYPKVSSKSSGGSIKAMKKKESSSWLEAEESRNEWWEGRGGVAQKKNFACLIRAWKRSFVTSRTLLPRKIIRCPDASLSEGYVEIFVAISQNGTKTETIFHKGGKFCVLEISILRNIFDSKIKAFILFWGYFILSFLLLSLYETHSLGITAQLENLLNLIHFIYPKRSTQIFVLTQDEYVRNNTLFKN